MKKFLVAAAVFLASSLSAYAQSCNGQFAAGTLCGNQSGSKAPPSANTTIYGLINQNCATPGQGSIPFLGSANLSCLVPGTSGLPLLSGGAGADVAYGIPALAAGGTGANLTASNGGIFYSTGSVAAILSGTSTARQMLQSGASGAPAWSTATWPATTTNGQLLYSSSANTVAGLASGSAGKVLTTDGTSPIWSTPTFPVTVGATGTVIQSNGTNWISSTPAWPTVAGTSGTVIQSNGTNLVNTTATYPGTATSTGTILRANGTNWAATTATYPATTTNGQLLYSSSANTVAGLTSGLSGQILSTNGTSPTWSTATFPSTAGAAGTILRSNGTNWINSTATWPDTTTTSQLLYSSGTNTVGGLATANSSVLVTSGTGVPSLGTALPNGVTATTQALPDATTKVATDAYVQSLLTGGGTVGTNAALAALTTTAFPHGVIRTGITTNGDVPPLLFIGQTGTCAANSLANDIGSCVDASGGNSFKAVYPNKTVSIDQFGADTTGGTDTTAKFTAAETAVSARGGGTITGGGTYLVNSAISCLSGVALDITGTIDAHNWSTAATSLITCSGSIGSSINTAANLTTGDNAISTTTANGFAVGDWILVKGQRCALYPEAGYWRLGHSTATGNSPLFSEVHQVSAITDTTHFSIQGSIYYPAYNTTADVGSTCPTTAARTVVKKFTWTTVNIHIANFILGGGGNGIKIQYAKDANIKVDWVDLSDVGAHAFQVVNSFNTKLEYTAYHKPTTSDIATYNTAEIISSWNVWINQTDYNPAQGIDVVWQTGGGVELATGWNVNITGKSYGAFADCLTFHAGTMNGSVHDYSCIDAHSDGIHIRSRSINLSNIYVKGAAPYYSDATSVRCGVKLLDAAIDLNVVNVTVDGYIGGTRCAVRVTRYNDAHDADSPVSRNISMTNIVGRNVTDVVMLGGDSDDYATAAPANIKLRNITGTNADQAVEVGAYYNYIDIDGVSLDTLNSTIGHVIDLDANSVGASIKNVRASNLSASSYLVFAAAVTDTTTFPVATYPTLGLNIDINSLHLDGVGILISSSYAPASRTADFTLTPNACINGPIIIGAALTVTVPTTAANGFPFTMQCFLYSRTSGTVTLSPAATVTIDSRVGLTFNGQYSAVNLFVRGTNAWSAYGDLNAP